MKTSVVSIRDMLFVLSVVGIEKRIGEVPDVESVTVDFARGKTTIRYDETGINMAEIKADLREQGHKSDAPTNGGQDDHKRHGAPVDSATHHPSPASSSTKHFTTSEQTLVPLRLGLEKIARGA
jgi:Cu2+-exporting ATPase